MTNPQPCCLPLRAGSAVLDAGCRIFSSGSNVSAIVAPLMVPWIAARGPSS